MRRIIKNSIIVVYTFIRLVFRKIIHGKNLKFHIIERFSPNVVLDFNKGSKVHFGRKVSLHSNIKIKVRKNAKLSIGSGVGMNYNCIVVCHDNITIGEGTEFGPSVFLYDHDHDYRNGLKSKKFLTAPIHIGKNCWIGANAVILRGTSIGDNCVIAAGSIVKGNIPANSVFVQKRESEMKSIK